MKRLAVFTLTAGLFGAGQALYAGPPVPVAGTAPTVPSVPAPILRGEVLTPVDSGVGPAAVPVHPRTPNDRLHAPRRLTGLGPAEPYDPYASNRAFAQTPPTVAPAPTPIGPAPGGPTLAPPVIEGPIVGTPAPAPAPTVPPLVVGGSCAGSDCGPARHTGQCWEKFKNWLCFRQTPVKLGLTPTPYQSPLASQFPCHSGPGCQTGPACGTAGGCAPQFAGRDGLPCRGTAGGCSPVAADPALPGYRFAGSVNPTVGGTPAPVVTSSFKMSPAPGVPAVPYRSGGTVNPRP